MASHLKPREESGKLAEGGWGEAALALSQGLAGHAAMVSMPRSVEKCFFQSEVAPLGSQQTPTPFSPHTPSTAPSPTPARAPPGNPAQGLPRPDAEGRGEGGRRKGGTEAALPAHTGCHGDRGPPQAKSSLKGVRPGPRRTRHPAKLQQSLLPNSRGVNPLTQLTAKQRSNSIWGAGAHLIKTAS